MNLPKLIIVACSAIGLASCGNKPSKLVADPQQGNNTPSVLVSKPQPRKSGRTFADWCRQKADLSSETKHTVEVLLKEAGTTDCDAANQKLSSLTALFLTDTQIGDIKPLASLTNLTFLNLINNQIGDIKPLASLTNLTQLNLNNNKISDIKPLVSLTKLEFLYLKNNLLNDIKPLVSLTNLKQFYLSGNQIAPKTCPLKPESICKWEPQPKP